MVTAKLKIVQRLMCTKSIVGHTFSLKKHITANDVKLFTALCDDQNSLHLERNVPIIVPGALINGYVSGVIGSHFPGPGSLLIEESFRFTNKCYVNDLLEICLRFDQKRKITRIHFDCYALNRNCHIMTGLAVVMISSK